MLDELLNKLPQFIVSTAFMNEMKRFLPTVVFDRTLGQEKFQQYLTNTLTALFIDVRNQLFENKREPAFKM